MKTIPRTAKAQVIVVFSLVLVALLVFAGLAVDGGLAYADRRADQNAADSSALAGASSIANTINQSPTTPCATLTNAAIAAAKQNAAKNNLTLENNLDNHNGVEVTCYPNNVYDVRVMVTTETGTSFMKLLSANSVKNTVEAVAHVELKSSPGGVLAGGLGLLALSKTAPSGVKLTGTGNIGTKDGDIHINSNGDNALLLSGTGTVIGQNIKAVGGFNTTGTGNSTASARFDIGKNLNLTGTSNVKGDMINVNGNVKLTGTGNLVARNGSGVINVNGTVTVTGTGKLSPAAHPGGASPVPTIEDPFIPLVNNGYFAPPAKPAGACPAKSFNGTSNNTLSPGCYSRISNTGTGSLTLNSGEYWITTGGISNTGTGSITIKDGSTIYIDKGDFNLTGTGNITAGEVLFYMGKDAGKFSLTGTGNVSVTPKTTGPYKGLTLFVDPANNKQVALTGTGNVTSMNGTFYAPSSALVLTGTGGISVLKAQIICSTAELAGTGNLTLQYDGNLFFGGDGQPTSVIMLKK